LRSAGAETLLASGANSTDRINSALLELGRRGITSLFLEGGRTLASAFMTAGAIDRARTFIAPVLLGGLDPGSNTAASRAGGVGEGGVEDDPARSAPRSPTTGPARQVALSTEVETVGEDLLITTRFREW
jgi:diaminohydroxyphosphoribosylaminopyrimidine deaminase/5-amino-6-(5-phosphoribosylamino)uracil reductase